MTRIGVIAGVGWIGGSLGGCATLSRGLDDEVAVVSEPAGAAVTSSIGAHCAATPCTLTVPRDAVFTVTVAMPGYASRSVDVATRISGTGAALATENVATGGLGLAVDVATGGALEHVPNAVDVTLTALAGPAPKPARASGHV
ncbi:MAG: hypothetical protein ACRYGP_06160, partial [Janthinobacterium lividum]